MNYVLILKRYSSDTGFFEVEKTECDDKEYKQYTAVCDSYCFRIDVTETYEDLRFGHYSSYTETTEANIPYENILIKDGNIIGFLYNTSQTPDGFAGHNGQIVFLLDDADKKKNVGGRASVGSNSSDEYCTLVRR